MGILPRTAIITNDYFSPVKSNQSKESISSNKSPSVNTNYKSSEDEKAGSFCSAYEAIAKAERWALKSGTVVEEQMLKLAKAALYEHPVQSMILDPDDPLWWPDYFSEADINEIKKYNAKSLPPLSQGLDEEMQLYDINWATGKEIYCTSLPMIRNMTLFLNLTRNGWKSALWDTQGCFFYDNLLQVADWSEADLLHNVWAFVYRAFQDHNIRACLGERCSAAVALGKNENRPLEAIEKRPRKAIGAKVDILFKASNKEIGSAEVGMDDGLQ